MQILVLSHSPNALARRLSAEDLRGGLGAVGRKMSSAAVERLVSDLDISGCGSLDLEVCVHLAANQQVLSRPGRFESVWGSAGCGSPWPSGVLGAICTAHSWHSFLESQPLVRSLQDSCMRMHVDTKPTKKVHLAQEFIAAALNRQEALNAKTLAEVFDKLDDDDDGEIGARALSCALQVSARRLRLSAGCAL